MVKSAVDETMIAVFYLIIYHWLKIVTKLVNIHASEIICTLDSGSSPSPLHNNHDVQNHSQPSRAGFAIVQCAREIILRCISPHL